MDHITLLKNFPPSEPCGCDICRNYCKRPGWWSTEQTSLAIHDGLAYRMMLEVSPEFTFTVISPAFSGNECKIALNNYAKNGCTFYKKRLCELHSSGHLPIECGFCHHDRAGSGVKCHTELEINWHTYTGQKIARRWCNIVGCSEGLELLEWIESKTNRYLNI